MKKLVICAVAFLSAAMFTDASARDKKDDPKHALNNGDVQYYYLPDIDAYYYVPRKQFIYQLNGYWTFSGSLPAANKDYDLRTANKVVVNEPGAYRYHAQHKLKYGIEQASNTKALENPASKNSKSERSRDKS
jgi:hypothetical protein